jgi:hypothetical protein
MKKSVLISVFLLSLVSVYAATGRDMAEYAGRYVFAGDGVAGEVDITLVDGTLVVETEIGRISLKHIKEDQFSIPQYGGVSVFERNENREISGVTVTIPMQVLTV